MSEFGKGNCRGWQITEIISEIERCLENEQFFAAISLAVILPDLCGAVEYGEKEKVGARYRKWCDLYFLRTSRSEEIHRENHAGFSSKRIASIDFLSPELMYKLRNQVLHVGGYSVTADLEGNDGSLKQNLKLCISAEMDIGTTHTPGSPNAVDCTETIEFNLIFYCRYLCAAVKSYYEKNKDKFNDSLLPILDYREDFKLIS